MIKNIRNLTNDFIENEKSVLLNGVTLGTQNNGDQIKEKDVNEITETVNTQLVQQHESRPPNEQQNMSEISITTNGKTDFSGVFPKRYTTTCWIKPRSVPYWYSESVLLFINSTKRKYEQSVYFKEKLLPVRWSETMSTELILSENQFLCASMKIPISDIYIPLDEVVA